MDKPSSENVSGEPARQEPDTVQTMETDSLEARFKEHGSEITEKFSENVSGEPARQEPDTVQTMETDSLEARFKEHGSEITEKFSENVSGGSARPEPDTDQTMEADSLEARFKEPGSETTEKFSENVSGEPTRQEPYTVQTMETDSLEARFKEPGSEITEKFSIAEDLKTKPNCGYLRPHDLGYDPESVNVVAENKVSESGTQEPYLLRNELRASSEDLTRNSTSGQVSLPLEDPKVASNLGNLGLQHESTVDGSTLEQLEPQPPNEFEKRTAELLEPTVKDKIENPSFTVGVGEEVFLTLDKSNDLVLDAIGNASFTVGVGDDEVPVLLDKSEDSGLPLDNRSNSALGNLVSSNHDGTENPSTKSFERTGTGAIESTTQYGLGDKGIPLQSRKRRSPNRPLVTSTIVLRSRSKEKPETPETNNVAAEVADDGKKKRKMRKKKQMSKNPGNEFSRIRSHLRYLLHRIKYEQNLIDAYSGEGWKGQSLEKIKPEKELQRAKCHILRYKLKIRELFHRLDLSLAEGKLPESLFDSEGEIDSEDIFCAKCGSKDLPDNNDIILCDGACERGFHQFCLEPPLLKEDIPPGDEGWLCPGCDCKVDCFELLNDFHGINLSLLDSWEKVFPEAASGNTQEDGSGFPSDDSEDDDYDPDKPELEKSQGDESSSDKSDYLSASDGLAASPDKEQYLRLPSEDSEDDDFDPDAPDHDEQIKQESSSSDFSSESEDLGALFDVTSPGEDQGQTSHDRGKLKGVRVEKQSLRDELSYLLDSIEAPASGKRHVERLDYKRLHDDTYGNVSSDSSDEDFEETACGGRRKKRSGKKSPVVEKGEDIEPEDCKQKATEHTTKRAQKKHDIEDRNNSSTSLKSSSEAGSGSKSNGRTYKKLGEVVTQRLFESFKENQYPKRPDKENLAKELGLTIQQVSKWFENARWSYRHSATMGSNVTAGGSSGRTSSLQSSQKSPDTEREKVRKDTTSNEVDKGASPAANTVVKVSQTTHDVGGVLEAGGQKSGTPKSRKRKGIGDQISNQNSSQEKKLKENSQASTLNSQQVRRSRRLLSGNS